MKLSHCRTRFISIKLKFYNFLPVFILMASSIWIWCWWCLRIIIHFNSSLFFNLSLLAPFRSSILEPYLHSCLGQVYSLSDFQTRFWSVCVTRMSPTTLVTASVTNMDWKSFLSEIFSGINIRIVSFLKHSFELAELCWSKSRPDEKSLGCLIQFTNIRAYITFAQRNIYRTKYRLYRLYRTKHVTYRPNRVK